MISTRTGKAAPRVDAAQLQQRIRDVRPGPDGFLYVLTAETDGVLMRLEPAPMPPAPAGRGRGGQ
jgi:glucose/arabinose dehydrogenase